MRAEGLDIFNIFELKSGDAQKFEKIIEKFDLPKTHVTYERYKFFSRNQKVGENFDKYVIELK